ncbi:MAG: carboxypeptidase M32, partial [Dongia sp.]
MNQGVNQAYGELEQRFKRWSALREASGMLHWDLAAIMPEGGHHARAEQLAALGVIGHQMLADPKVGDLLGEAGAKDGLSDWQRANLGEMRRLYIHATALDADLVEAMSMANSAAEAAWRVARPAADFKAVKPQLETVFKLVREAAHAKAEKLGVSPYEALMDEHEPGNRTADVDKIFDTYGAFLPDFLERVLERQAREPAPIEPKGPFPVAAQKALGERVMKTIGFDFKHGRLDTSLHPICGGVPDDVRITTRYTEDQVATALMGIIHETGHAMYERGLPVDWRLQPVGYARGMALHESQSLLVEMQASRGADFCAYLSPILNEVFPGNAAAFAPDNLRRLYSRVSRGFIRVDADEVTYPAHVILRYRLEQALIADELKVADIPAAWNEGMKALLGIVPPSDREGCLQDIHWFDGGIGYFPCYSLGAMTAAQFFEAACAAKPEIPAEIERGKFDTLQGWLKANVHELGSSLSTPGIVTHATGRPLDIAVFKRHLE